MLQVSLQLFYGFIVSKLDDKVEEDLSYVLQKY
jgi:hypothetical protein